MITLVARRMSLALTAIAVSAFLLTVYAAGNAIVSTAVVTMRARSLAAIETVRSGQASGNLLESGYVHARTFARTSVSRSFSPAPGELPSRYVLHFALALFVALVAGSFIAFLASVPPFQRSGTSRRVVHAALACIPAFIIYGLLDRSQQFALLHQYEASTTNIHDWLFGPRFLSVLPGFVAAPSLFSAFVAAIVVIWSIRQVSRCMAARATKIRCILCCAHCGYPAVNDRGICPECGSSSQAVEVPEAVIWLRSLTQRQMSILLATAVTILALVAIPWLKLGLKRQDGMPVVEVRRELFWPRTLGMPDRMYSSTFDLPIGREFAIRADRLDAILSIVRLSNSEIVVSVNQRSGSPVGSFTLSRDRPLVEYRTAADELLVVSLAAADWPHTVGGPDVALGYVWVNVPPSTSDLRIIGPSPLAASCDR